jgi:hypothetical protein
MKLQTNPPLSPTALPVLWHVDPAPMIYFEDRMTFPGAPTTVVIPAEHENLRIHCDGQVASHRRRNSGTALGGRSPLARLDTFRRSGQQHPLRQFGERHCTRPAS